MLCFAKGFTINLTADSAMQTIYIFVGNACGTTEKQELYHSKINVYLTTLL